ncbi:PIN domain-containing protein [Nocardia sp. NPDC058497]|uniref:PIN domain-containing protein n=1 Tax=Nocardia sp. NPDC058497 TaxID=3346529 RepID=UPI00366421D2
MNDSIAQRARKVQHLMTKKGHHRSAVLVDLLTAAVAEQHDAVIIHYDRDFEHIAAVTRQPQVWVVPAGTID